MTKELNIENKTDAPKDNSKGTESIDLTKTSKGLGKAALKAHLAGDSEKAKELKNQQMKINRNLQR